MSIPVVIEHEEAIKVIETLETLETLEKEITHLIEKLKEKSDIVEQLLKQQVSDSTDFTLMMAKFSQLKEELKKEKEISDYFHDEAADFRKELKKEQEKIYRVGKLLERISLNQKVTAIKLYRALNNSSLLDAKSCVEQIQEKQRQKERTIKEIK